MGAHGLWIQHLLSSMKRRAWKTDGTASHVSVINFRQLFFDISLVCALEVLEKHICSFDTIP